LNESGARVRACVRALSRAMMSLAAVTAQCLLNRWWRQLRNVQHAEIFRPPGDSKSQATRIDIYAKKLEDKSL
jgi:hypothetical protein